MKHLAKVTAVFLLLTLLPGCWSKEEMNDRAFVTVLFVDRDDNGQLELSLGFFLANRLNSGQVTAATGQNQKPYTIISRKGRTLLEAYSLIQGDLPRRVTWGPTRIIVVGERFAKQGIEPLLEFVFRVPYLRMKANIYAVRGEAKIVSEMAAVFERFPSEIMREFSHMNLTLSETVKDLLYAQSSAKGNSLLPMLVVSKKRMLSEDGRKQVWVGTGGAAVIRNNRWVGEIKREETRGAMWFTGKIENAFVITNSPTDGKKIGAQLYQMTRSLSVKRKQGRYMVQGHFQANGEMSSSESNIDLTDPVQLTKIEKSFAGLIKQEIEQTLAQTRKLKADVFHLSNYIRWNWPADWQRLDQEWNEAYARMVDVHIDVDVVIRRLGEQQKRSEQDGLEGAPKS